MFNNQESNSINAVGDQILNIYISTRYSTSRVSTGLYVKTIMKTMKSMNVVVIMNEYN